MGRIIPYIMENKSHVWNHQPEMMRLCTFLKVPNLVLVTENLGIPRRPVADFSSWIFCHSINIPFGGSPKHYWNTTVQWYGFFSFPFGRYTLFSNTQISGSRSESVNPQFMGISHMRFKLEKPTSQWAWSSRRISHRTNRSPQFLSIPVSWKIYLKHKMCSLLNRIYWRIQLRKNMKWQHAN